MSLRTMAWGLVALGMVAAGCQKTQRETAGPPPDDDRIRAITMSYKSDPTVRLAVVTAKLAEANLVAATSDTPADFKEDAVVMFIDTNEHAIAHGKVIRVVNSDVHIAYEALSAEQGGRAPSAGDVAVHILK